MAVKIEVASLLSKMGFEIDVTQLEKFEKMTRTLRTSTVKLARDLRQTNNQLNSVGSKLKGVNSGLNSVGAKRGASSLAQSYASLSKNVSVTQTSMKRFDTTITLIDPKLTTQADKVAKLAVSWATYAKNVRDANAALRQRPPRSPQGSPRGSGGGGAGSSFAGGAAGGLAGNAARFGGAFLPAAALATAAGSAGLMTQKIISTGRDYQAMQQILMGSSKANDGLADYQRNLNFAKKTSQELGVNVIEFGKAYAKTIQSVGDSLSRKDSETMFKGFSELMVVMHSSDDDQKGVFRAMSQMFSKGKIQMEEVNQMAERNIPALAMIKKAYQELGMTQAQFEKAQQQGKLDPSKFLPLMGKYASEFARNNGALDKALAGSMNQQNLFMNRLREMSNDLMEAGLDKLVGDLFKGMIKLADSMKPVAMWLLKVAQGLAWTVGGIVEFTSKHPAIAATLAMIVAGLVAMVVTMRGGIPVGGAFFAVLIRGLQLLKVAMIKTAILAVFIALAEVMVSLYEHFNGENNWISVLIGWMGLLGLKLQNLMMDFKILMTMLTVGFKDSWLGRFFERLFGFDFNKISNEKNVEEFHNKTQGVSDGYKAALSQSVREPKPSLMPSAMPVATKAIFGAINFAHSMEIIGGGKTVYNQKGTQKIDVGGLKQ